MFSMMDYLPQTSFMYLKVAFHFIIDINLKPDLIVKQEMNEKSTG